MILTVDIGNSRIKWALWGAGEIVARAAAFYEVDSVAEAFDQLLVDVNQDFQQKGVDSRPITGYLSSENLAQVCAVNVAGDVIKRALSTWVKQRWQREVVYLETQKQYKNISHAYDDPTQHGVDRWAGIVAACKSNPDNSICVIGAGTAITVDLIKNVGLKKNNIKNHEEPQRYFYQHLGGYILPSFVSMHNALSVDTVKASSVPNIEYDKKGVPNNTSDAVNQGLHLLLQAGIRELCGHAKEQLGESLQITITGGYAQTILNYPDMPAMDYEPDLVMKGAHEMIQQQRAKSPMAKSKKAKAQKIRVDL